MMNPTDLARLSNAVRLSSENLVVAEGANLGSLNTNWPYIDAASPLLTQPALDYIEARYNTSPQSTDINIFASYLALSTFCHTLDGWRYLSQSALALLQGARSSALHLAYYAELRAALSILSGSGIAILKGKHFSLDAVGNVYWFKGNTHECAWLAIKEWVGVTSNAGRVVRSFSSLGFTGDEWAEACQTTALSQNHIADFWLQNWTVDLKHLDEDQQRRNNASYRPNLSLTSFDLLKADELDFLRDVNSSFTPESNGQFSFIDLAIISDLCKEAHNIRGGAQIQQLWEHIKNYWVNQTQVISETKADQILQEIQDVSSKPGGALLQMAGDINNGNVENVFSRSILMLRLSSALLRQQWEKIRQASPSGRANWQKEVLRNFALHSNLFDHNSQISDFQILDADQVEAQDKIEDWLTSNSGSFSPHLLWKDRADSLIQLCRLERVGVMASAV